MPRRSSAMDGVTRETVQGDRERGNLPPMSLAKPGGISFEFFPPASDVGEANLWQSIGDLAQISPDFVSVTYGAGGSTRDRTLRVTQRIKSETQLFPVAHLTCVGVTATELTGLIKTLQQAGVTSLMALRGDPPGGIDQTWQPHPAGLKYAVELVALANELGVAEIGVAAFPDKHPESPSLEFDIEVLKAKQDAGASFAITQLFFDLDSYFKLVDRAESAGITIPIRPGIMPLTDPKQIEKFSALAGAPMPTTVRDYFVSATANSDDTAKRGVEFATDFAQKLIAGGAPGIHLYTMNKSAAAKQVSLNLKS